MSSKHLKFGSFTARLAVILLAGLAFALPSLKAQEVSLATPCQMAIQNYLTAHGEGTITSASSSALAAAVASAMTSNTNPLLTPPDFAISALLPDPWGSTPYSVIPQPRRDADAVAVAAAAINQIIATGLVIGPTELDEQIARVSEYLLDEGYGNSNFSLDLAGKEAVLQTALTTITNAYASATPAFRPVLKYADEAVGQKLTDDGFLEGLAGVTGTNPAYAPYAARYFVTGLMTSSSNTFTWPNQSNGVTITQFTQDVLTNVVSNGTLDNLVTNAISTNVYANAASNLAGRETLDAIGEALFNQFTASNPTSATNEAIDTALTTGLESGVTQGLNEENQRIAFASALTTAEVASAVSIEKGAIYVDPYYAGQFTNGIFTNIKASSAATLVSDAPALATGAGNIIGSDGNVLTQVANTFSTFIGTGALSATNAGTYALELINGAQLGTEGPILGGGGKFKISTTASLVDVASIADVMAAGVKASFGSSISTAQAPTFGSDIGLIAQNMGYLLTAYSFTDSLDSNRSIPMAEFVAGTLADYIVALNLGATAQADALNDIKTDIDTAIEASFFGSSTKTQVVNEVNAAVTAAPAGTNGFGGDADGDYGAIAVQETTVTNM
jgi:hypothetical protein